MKVVIISFFLLIVLLSLQESKTESPSRYCGSSLPQILYLVCSGEYAEKRAKLQNPLIQFIKDWQNVGKTVDGPELIENELLPPNELESSDPNRMVSRSDIFDFRFPRNGDVKALGFHRVRRQIHDECCLRPCTSSYIKKYYCANGGK